MAVVIPSLGLLTLSVGCTTTEIANGDCENVFDGEHLDIKYHACEVDAAWSQIMSLHPRGRTRFTPLNLGNPGVHKDSVRGRGALTRAG